MRGEGIARERQTTRGTGEGMFLLFFSSFFSLFFFSFFLVLPQSITDGRFRRYHPVAGGPRTNQLVDWYVLPDKTEFNASITNYFKNKKPSKTNPIEQRKKGIKQNTDREEGRLLERPVLGHGLRPLLYVEVDGVPALLIVPPDALLPERNKRAEIHVQPPLRPLAGATRNKITLRLVDAVGGLRDPNPGEVRTEELHRRRSAVSGRDRGEGGGDRTEAGARVFVAVLAGKRERVGRREGRTGFSFLAPISFRRA
ncbi:hypothetical protein BHM03_00061192 [Ensete ventricosum]|nr:hypothetical protein BHM03_00061192 [Ensete ventricosum]